jgi:hypothetical protein
MELAVRARSYCRGSLGFVAVVVHGNDLWTSGSALPKWRAPLLEREATRPYAHFCCQAICESEGEPGAAGQTTRALPVYTRALPVQPPEQKRPAVSV